MHSVALYVGLPWLQAGSMDGPQPLPVSQVGQCSMRLSVYVYKDINNVHTVVLQQLEVSVYYCAHISFPEKSPVTLLCRLSVLVTHLSHVV